MKKPVKMLSFAAIFGVVFAIRETFATSRSAGSLPLLDFRSMTVTVDLGGKQRRRAIGALFDRLDRDHERNARRTRELEGPAERQGTVGRGWRP